MINSPKSRPAGEASTISAAVTPGKTACTESRKRSDPIRFSRNDNKKICSNLEISERAVRAHASHVLFNLGWSDTPKLPNSLKYGLPAIRIGSMPSYLMR
jgi:hypothetical protein